MKPRDLTLADWAHIKTLPACLACGGAGYICGSCHHNWVTHARVGCGQWEPGTCRNCGGVGRGFMTDRAAWLAQRRLGIGGSDAASLLNIGYGCQRRLWYEKRNETPDFPREETAAMALGSFLEPFFADMYAAKTGRPVYALKFPVSHPDVPELIGNVDRMTAEVVNSVEWPLEIKSVGREVFYKTKREGLWIDAVAQLQHYMLVTGARKGSYAIGSRDSGDLLYFDTPRDENVCNKILEAVAPFWALVQNGPAPDRLEPDDKRCQRCEYRRTCQGSALIQLDTNTEMPQVESLRPLISEYSERKANFEEAESQLDETKEELKATLGDRQAVMVGETKVYYRPQAGRELIKGKPLLEAYKKAMAIVDKKGLGRDLPPTESFVEIAKGSRPLRII